MIEIGYSALGMNPDNNIKIVSVETAHKIIPSVNGNKIDVEFEENVSMSFPGNVSLHNPMVPVFKNVKSFSDIPNESSLHIIEIIPNINDGNICHVHLSNGQFWVLSPLNQETALFLKVTILLY